MRTFKLLLLSLCAPVMLQAQNIITTIAGNGTEGHSGDGGAAVNAKIAACIKGRLDAQGNFYFPEPDSQRIRKVSTSGIITTVAGSGVQGYNADGIFATIAALNLPVMALPDSAGNLFIADQFNHRVRRVDAMTGIITTICGTGNLPDAGDGGPANLANIPAPRGMVFDSHGNLYIGCAKGIRKIDALTNIITTVVTIPDNRFVSICIDKDDNIYYSELRKIFRLSNMGVLTQVGGTGNSGCGIEGQQAMQTDMSLGDVAVDDYGNVFYTDLECDHVRMINTNGVVMPVAGSTSWIPLGDGGPALEAMLNTPLGIDLDDCGNMYICDAFNYRIRKVTLDHCNALSVSSISSSTSFSVAPNPVTSKLTITSTNQINSISIIDITGREVLHSTETTIDVSGLVSGVYFVRVVDVTGGVSVEKVVKE